MYVYFLITQLDALVCVYRTGMLTYAFEWRVLLKDIFWHFVSSAISQFVHTLYVSKNDSCFLYTYESHIILPQSSHLFVIIMNGISMNILGIYFQV